ncbi:MAG TPA: hypothetical protein VGQ73_03855, partial [Gemmatimonadales bacterium]|jgi:hypothetical protein|nr:hypothetical protein [Gemmatimonadales bacterium]
MRRVEAAVARLTDSWPASERVAVGGAASTFSVGTHVLGASYEWKGPTAVERFHPPLAISLEWPGQPFEPVLRQMLAGPPAKVDCARLPVWPRVDQTPRFVLHLLVEPRRLEQCRAAVAETAPTP